MKNLMLSAVLILLSMITFTSNAQERTMQISEEDMPYMLNYQNLEDSFGRVVLSNDKVVLQRLVVPGGEWEGIHSHPGNQLFVHIYGGYWSGQLGGEYEYRHELSSDGEVGWMDHIPYEDGHNSGNSGEEAIDLIYVNLKKQGDYGAGSATRAQEYPNIPMEVVFENERMIVQRGDIAPGQWSGAHSRPGNQLYILVKGGQISERSGGGEAQSEMLEDGAPKWLDAGEGYEFGNGGDNTIDMVLITIK